MKLVDFERHFYTSRYLEHLRGRRQPPREAFSDRSTIRRRYEPSPPDYWVSLGQALKDRRLNIGEERIERMDRARVDIQVLSLSIPGCDQMDPGEGLSLARQPKARPGRLIDNFPDQFMDLASLTPRDPGGSAEELERSVTEQGLCGALVGPILGTNFWIIHGSAPF